MPSATLPGLLDRLARRQPHRPALVGGHEVVGRWVLSWSGLRRRVQATADELREAGAGAGDPVLVAAPGGPRRLVAALAVHALGAPQVPLRRGLPASQAESVAEAADPALAVVGGDGAPGVPEDVPAVETGDLPPLDEPLEGEVEGELPGPDPDDEALLLPTGWGDGTEFLPVTAGEGVAGVEAAAEALPLGPGDRVLQAAGPTHVPARVAGTLAPLVAGASVAFPATGSDPAGAQRGAALLDAARRTDATALSAATPEVADVWRAADGALGPLDAVVAAGDPLPEAAREALAEAGTVVEAHGPAETGPVVACGTREEGGLPPVPGVEVAEGEEGLRVRGPGVPRAAAEDGWMATGWTGSVDGDGRVHPEGRLAGRVAGPDGTVAAGALEASLRAASPVVARVAVADLEEGIGAAVVADGAQVPAGEAGEKTRKRVAGAAARVEPEPERVFLVEEDRFGGDRVDHAGEVRRQAWSEEMSALDGSETV
jgi:acyl-coenzyme A synthetase/AMP-(fatty) acid ligase